jgi:hypothetical protein
MTTAVDTLPNGRVRKTLASQLDRLDAILDGLADALNESVAAAVEKAVGNVIAEILTNPAFTDRLRAPAPPAPVMEDHVKDATAPRERGFRLWSKMTGALRAGSGHIRRAGSAVLRRAAAVAESGLSYVSRLLLRGRVLVYAGTLLVLGVLAFVAVPRLSLLLTAAAGWIAALVARARFSLRPAQLTCDLDTQ